MNVASIVKYAGPIAIFLIVALSLAYTSGSLKKIFDSIRTDHEEAVINKEQSKYLSDELNKTVTQKEIEHASHVIDDKVVESKQEKTENIETKTKDIIDTVTRAYSKPVVIEDKPEQPEMTQQERSEAEDKARAAILVDSIYQAYYMAEEAY